MWLVLIDFFCPFKFVYGIPIMNCVHILKVVCDVSVSKEEFHHSVVK